MNEKSIFKFVLCKTKSCAYRTATTSGKHKGCCPKCAGELYIAENWQVRITYKGKLYTKSVSPRRRDAEDYLAECKVKIKNGTFMVEPPKQEQGEQDIPWSQAVKDCTKWWADAVKQGLLKQSSADYYKWQMVPLTEYFGEKTLLTIRKADVLDYATARTEEDIAPSTINHEIKALKRIYSIHVARTSAEESPRLCGKSMDIARVALLKKSSQKARYLTESEITLLLEKATTPEVKMATLIALNTGLRKSNVLNLTWAEVRLSKRLIEIPGHKMKSTKPHTVDIPEHLIEVLREWKKRPLSRYLFPDKSGQETMVRFRTEWDKTIKACEFTDVSFHCLRHTYASHYLMGTGGLECGDLSTLSEILQHASISITKDLYGHISREHIRKATDKFAESFLSSFK